MSFIDDEGERRTLLASFHVEPDETLFELLARVGERCYQDPATGATFTLADLYALADIDPQETVASIHEAVLPLEGLCLRLDDLATARARLETLLDNEGLERLEEEHAGSPPAATELRAVALSGVSGRSSLGKYLADKTIGDVAAMSREECLKGVLDKIPAKQHKRASRQARDVWARASRVAKLREEWLSEE